MIARLVFGTAEPDSPSPGVPNKESYHNVQMRHLLIMAVSLVLSISAQSRTAVITVNPDGTFSPQLTYIRSGDTVRWEKLTRTDSIIPVTGSIYPAMCAAQRAYNAADLNEFTGPMTFGPSGVFTLSP